MTYTRRTIQRHRKVWLEALRSGEYAQTTGWLQRAEDEGPGGYCCLGVACEKARLVPNLDGDVYTYDGEDTHLPVEAQEWLGLTSRDPVLNTPAGDWTFKGRDGYGQASLVDLNDHGWSFEDIADAVEEFGFIPQHDQLQQEQA